MMGRDVTTDRGAVAPLGPGLPRRDFLRIGVGASLGLGLTGGLGRLLAQETRTDRVPGQGRAKRCIVLYMNGGMSQTDTFDPKPGTASAGPLGAIRTAAEGVVLSELLPRLAAEMKHVSLIRSMATREGAHQRARYLLHTGYMPNGTVEHPDLGALASEALRDPELDLPAYVCVNGQGIGQGFLDVQHAPFRVPDPTREVEGLAYPEGVDARRFARRRRLLEAIERKFKREHPGAETAGHTKVYEKADRMMHSPQTAAFDLSEEPSRLREAYGLGRFGQGCLMARRLIQTGARVVEVQLGGWDTHQDNFTRNRALAAQLDAGFATLLADLREKELLEDTLVLCLSEFGRTPRINGDDGRDHFANGWTVALAGGPIRGGRVVGATSEDGSRVAERPVGAADLMATACHALGIDPSAEHYTREGRPIRVVAPGGRPVRELL